MFYCVEVLNKCSWPCMYNCSGGTGDNGLLYHLQSEES